MQQQTDKSTGVQMKRIGELFTEAGLLSQEDLKKGLDYGKKTSLPLGRVLVMLRLASDADLRAVLHVQQLMKFEGMPGNLAVRALQYMHERKVHIEWAVKQIGWESDKFRKDLPPALREIKEKIADAESRLGADHPDVAEMMLKLVDFYIDERMWAHAEATAMQALEKLERAHGETDLRVAEAATKYSDVLFFEDRFDEALPLAQRALTIRQRMLGEDHPIVGSSLRQVGEIYDVKRAYSDAERCYTQALTVIEKTHEIDDPEVLYVIKVLGHVCRRAGRTPDTVLVGALLTEAGMVDAAKVPEALAYGKEKGVPMARALVMMELLSEDALRPVLHAQLLIRSNLLPAQIGIRALRLSHKYNLSLEDAMERIGWRLQLGRKYELTQLLQTHDQLLEAERTLPADHPDVGALCLRLADLFETYERYADAEPLFKRALAVMEKTEGQEEAMAEILDRLAWVHVKQQKYEQAEAIYRKVLELRIALAGEDSADVATSYMNLGRLQIARGDHTDGVIWLQKAIPLAEKHLGSKHPSVADIVEQMALSFLETGEHDRAEPLFWQAYKIKSEYMDVTSYEIVTLLTKLADMYNKDGKYTMADSVLVLFQQNKSVMI
jgi:tetratricopeptide (TPR) repeat protein